MSLFSFFQNLGQQYQSSLFVTDLFKFLDIRPVVARPRNAIVLEQASTPVIIFDRVTFTYPGTHRPALKDFSLVIPPGEKLALVGLNGAGKSTFVKLLCRFYDPESGRITVDCHDLRDLDLQSWYHHLGVLFQEYAHYHFPMSEAIAVGRTSRAVDADWAQMAAAAAEADGFIRRWPEGYRQMLGKEFTGGIEPSIGQWQKLALARTLYREPRVYVLDEPTAAIDAQSEARIFERLAALPEDRSVILIAHRFSTVRRAGRICVIEDGRVSELGTHDELLEAGGGYARLFSLQAAGYR